MNNRRTGIVALALATYVGASALTADAAACGGEWYPVIEVDHRIHGVAQAEKALANGKTLAAAASVLRMVPHIKALKGKPGSLVARSERVLALALARSQGSLPVTREVPREVAGSWLGETSVDAARNLAWSIETLRRQATSKADDIALQTELGEALSQVPEHRAEARRLLESLAKRDLIASPQGYAALAQLLLEPADADSRKLALQRCEAMAKSPSACALRS